MVVPEMVGPLAGPGNAYVHWVAWVAVSRTTSSDGAVASRHPVLRTSAATGPAETGSATGIVVASEEVTSPVAGSSDVSLPGLPEHDVADGSRCPIHRSDPENVTGVGTDGDPGSTCRVQISAPVSSRRARTSVPAVWSWPSKKARPSDTTGSLIAPSGKARVHACASEPTVAGVRPLSRSLNRACSGPKPGSPHQPPDAPAATSATVTPNMARRAAPFPTTPRPMASPPQAAAPMLNVRAPARPAANRQVAAVQRKWQGGGHERSGPARRG